MSKRPVVPDQLETERLLIRAPRLEDLNELYQAVIESIADLQPWMPWATNDYSLESCETNLRQAIGKFITQEDFRLSFFDKHTGRFMGNGGLHRIDWSVPRFEIGYWCRSSATGQGYVTEAARALSKLCFEQLGAARIEICCDDLNTKSAAVALRCGYTLEGVMRNDERNTKGELRSTRIYALTNIKDLT
jgi:RimJ/RimL family protein N-acetyltransferase